MIRSIIKEVFIIILLIVAIILILGIIFYECMPTTKTIPSVVTEYSLPEEMVEELDEEIESFHRQNIVQTYSVDGSDLKRYEATESYDKGRANPFEQIYKSTNNVDAPISNKVDAPILNIIK